MTRPSPLATWCRLLRLPNLFTVPGDPLAGFLLATGGLLDWRVGGRILNWRVPAAMGTSLLLYSAGLLLNDYFDRHIDARERPERPIPSGAAKATTVLSVGLALLLMGVGLAFVARGLVAGSIAAALAFTVLAYDAGLKSIGGVGQVAMGACRAGSILVGAAFAGGPFCNVQVLAAAGTAWAYTACVTAIAASETSRPRVGPVAFAPAIALTVGALILLSGSPQSADVWPALKFALHAGPWPGYVRDSGWPYWPLATILLLFAAAGAAALNAHRFRQGRMSAPSFVGKLIRLMIVTQAGWWFWALRWGTEGSTQNLPLLLIALFVCLWGAAERTSRRFYGS